jgi:hypothetical protein
MVFQPRLHRPCQKFPTRHHEWVRTAHQPRSTGFRAGTFSRGVTTPVSRVYLPVSLTAPGPSGSPEPTQLRRGCSHPPRRPPDQAASSFTSPLRRQRNGRSLTSIRNNSASWRTRRKRRAGAAAGCRRRRSPWRECRERGRSGTVARWRRYGGARGRCRLVLRINHTVLGASWWPSPASSPWIRR